ncbi:MAG: hypothetical protein KGN79_15535 [Acidobacteriota bacterium]|nr:hypothetical protein [Acidobacteriota bacterium]
MSEFNKLERNAAKTAALNELDPAVQQAIGDFKASVHAWSDNAMTRPRTVVHTAVRHGWRFAAAWAMSASLLLAGVSGGFYVHHRNEVQKEIALEQQKQEQQRQLAQRRALQEERLLANVDSDLSREVPEAMEPLAQLMNESNSQ